MSPSWWLGKKQNPCLCWSLLRLVLCWSLLVSAGSLFDSAGSLLVSAGLFAGSALAVTYVGGGLRGLSRPGVACRGQEIFCPVSLFDDLSSQGHLIAGWSCAWSGSANRCHWSVARFFSFHSGGGEDARGGYGGFFGWSAALAVLEANLVVNLCKSRVRALSRGPAVAGHEVAS
jgi:hypothetical protein